MNIPNINANAVVLIGIAFFILANVVIVLCFRHISQRNDDWDRAFYDRMRDDEGRGVGE